MAFASWKYLVAKLGGRIKLNMIGVIGQVSLKTEPAVSFLQMTVWDHDFAIFTPGDTGFLAFLGSPYGTGPLYFLMQHKRVLGLKTFSRIIVGWDWRFFSGFILFEVDDKKQGPNIFLPGTIPD